MNKQSFLPSFIIRLVIVVLCSFTLFVSCAKRIYDVVYPTLNDGKYDTEFPYRDCSKQLEDIAQSVKRINTIGYYESFVFSDDLKIRARDIDRRTIRKYADREEGFHQTASGTATVIYERLPKVALLTCAHIVDHPDTVYSYYPDEDGRETEFVRRISFKSKQDNYITDFREGGHLQILTMDEKNDIAIMGVDVDDLNRYIPVFNYPAGRAGDLEWGSFVYVLGYPMGFQMITRGIVSKPLMEEPGRFLIDALFNRGISGGLVLAVRDGVPNFELVGMARSVSAQREYVLKPEKEIEEYSYDPRLPYDGTVYVHQMSNIRYGITHAVSTETIRRFIVENIALFDRYGFDFRSVFKEMDE